MVCHCIHPQELFKEVREKKILVTSNSTVVIFDWTIPANFTSVTLSDSTRVEIDSDTNSVVVTWWETTETSDTPVMKVSNDFGKTFGPLLKLAGNGAIASGEVKPVL